MFFFALFLVGGTAWLLPWWSLCVIAFLLGVFLPGSSTLALRLSLGAGVAWAAVAFLGDGANHGMVSVRLARMLSLPAPELIFVIVFVLGALTSGLWFMAGRVFAPGKTT